MIKMANLVLDNGLNVNKETMPALTGSLAFEKAKTVFELLSGEAYPSDDTLMEKFCVWIRTEICDPESIETFLSQSSFTETVAQYLRKEPLSGNVFCVFLRIGSYVGGLSFTTIESQLSTLYQRALGCGLWQEASVRNTWIQGLSSLCADHAALQWISQHGYVTRVLQCLSDSSMFVRKSAISFISRYWGQCKGQESSLTKVVCCDVDQIKTHIKDTLALGSDEEDLHRKRISLDLLCDMNERYVDLIPTLEEDLHLYENLINLFLSDTDTYSQALRVLGNLIDAGCITESQTRNLREMPNQLLKQKKQLQAIIIAVWLFQRFPEECQVYLDVISSPLLVSGAYVLPDTTSHIRTKRSHIKLVICSLRGLQQINLDSDNAFVVLGNVVDLLCCCCGNCQTGVPAEQFAYLIECRRIQQVAIETSQKILSGRSFDPNLVSSVKKLLEECCCILHDISVSFKVTDAALKCVPYLLQALKEILKMPSDPDEDAALETVAFLSPRLGSLTEGIQRRLCDLKWEVRDSTLEMLGILAHQTKENSSLMEWFVREKFSTDIWHGLEDAEGFVRATALTALKHIVLSTDIWNQHDDSLSQDLILEKVGHILKNDPEASPRRAAAELLRSWNEVKQLNLFDIMTLAIRDGDWEVKIKVLQYWESYLSHLFKELDGCNETEPLPSYVLTLYPEKRNATEEDCQTLPRILHDICQSGCGYVLLAATEDCDKPVQSKVFQILHHVKTKLNYQYLGSNSCPSKQLKLSETASDQFAGADTSSSLYRSVKALSDTDTSSACSVRYSGFSRDAAALDSYKELSVNEFVCALERLDLVRLQEESDKPTDLHDVNPESLLDDILCSITQKHIVEDDDIGSYITDCY